MKTLVDVVKGLHRGVGRHVREVDPDGTFHLGHAGHPIQEVCYSCMSIMPCPVLRYISAVEHPSEAHLTAPGIVVRQVAVTAALRDELEFAIRTEAHVDDQVAEVFRILGIEVPAWDEERGAFVHLSADDRVALKQAADVLDAIADTWPHRLSTVPMGTPEQRKADAGRIRAILQDSEDAVV